MPLRPSRLVLLLTAAAVVVWTSPSPTHPASRQIPAAHRASVGSYNDSKAQADEKTQVLQAVRYQRWLARLPGVPTRLTSTEAAFDAPVEQLGVDAKGNIDTPHADIYKDAGWYKLGPMPGAQGVAIFDGHLDWTAGPAVFVHLDRIHVGDPIMVTIDGRVVDFIVDFAQPVPFDKPPAWLFAPTDQRQIALITCAGSLNPVTRSYNDRLIVRATLAL